VDSPPDPPYPHVQWRRVLLRRAVSLLGRGIWIYNPNRSVVVAVREIDMAETETSTPDVQTQVIVLAVVRAVLLILGTFGVTWAQTVSGSAIEQVAGAGAILVGIAWSLYQKFQQARLDHLGNVASARAAKAIKVFSTDGVPPV
jgi:hypothetical protein